MSTGKTNPLRAHPNPSIRSSSVRASLLLLREALTAAERATPSHPRRVDANEQRALQLIARMQAPYQKVTPFLEGCDTPGRQGVPVQFHEMAGTHAR
jgi:hypothetical protein